jgi:spoIIIJ-associated protein
MTVEGRNRMEFTASSVEEAVALGLVHLGLRADQVTVTVLEPGRPDDAPEGGAAARILLTPIAASGGGDADLEAVRSVVQDLVDRMRLRAQTTAQWMDPEDARESRHILVDIRGQDMGILVSRRGEVLAAMQYITRLLAARRLGRPLPVILDVEGYRQRREQQLRRMARRAADQAVERGRTVILEPMPANERRVIHIELREHPGVTTESVGIGKQRKVTIIPRAPADTEAPKSG